MTKPTTVVQLYKAAVSQLAGGLKTIKSRTKRQSVMKRGVAALKLRKQRANYILKMPRKLRPKKNCVQTAKERLHKAAWEMARQLENADL